jgi:hypothetical protein
VAANVQTLPARTDAQVVTIRKWVVLVAVLLIVTIIVTHNISRGEFDYNVDESQHAATGLYVASIVKDAPAHPVAYTYRYYAQYPALSGVIHWPPLFYTCEGAMFLLLGPTVVAARLTVLLFVLVGCLFWFLLVAELLNEWAAALSTLLLALLPFVLLFEKSVMLEIPCLALSIAALYYWHRFLRSARTLHLYLFAIFFSLASLTKQNSIFIPVTCLVTLGALHKWPLVLNRRFLGAAALIAALVAPFYILAYVVEWKTLSLDLLGQQGTNASHASFARFLGTLLFYVRALPNQLSWLLLVLIVIGAATCCLWSTREARVLMLAWIASCYVVFTLISHKEPRYTLYALPPLTFFLVGPLTAPWRPTAAKILAPALACVLLVHAVVAGWRYQRPYIEGYEPVAERIKQLGTPAVILFEASLPANFIFFLRRLDSQREFVVLRKSLRATRIKAELGWEDLATTIDQVRDVVDQNGVRYIVVSDGEPRYEAEQNLRILLQSDSRFKMLGTFPITGNEPEWQNRHLYLYENSLCNPPAGGSLRIRMLTTGHDVVIPWSELLNSKSAP